MKRPLFALLLTALALLLAACNITATGDTSTDANAAQSFLPNVSGYQQTDADSITDALGATGQQAADIFGNAVIQEAVTRIDGLITCFSSTGSVAARVYTQVNVGELINQFNQSGGGRGSVIPGLGAVAVVNQTRVQNNIASCVAQASGLQAQGVESVCTGNGNFTSGGDQFTYVFAGTNQAFCDTVQSHFNQYPAS